ncbi:MAG: TetR/AcrR family transcriptional regulator [Acidimicrobiia bacterium]
MVFERPADSQLPLRQRKKLRTMRRIQHVALELLAGSSYDEVTVEQIAAATDVSPSTVYRYFQTKEGIFLWDEYDEAVMEVFRRRLTETNPMQAMTEAIGAVLAGGSDPDLDQQTADFLSVVSHIPQLRESLAVRLDQLRRDLAREIAETGWPPLESAVFAGAMVGSFTGLMEAWVATGEEEPLTSSLGRAVRMVASGFDSVFDTGPSGRAG